MFSSRLLLNLLKQSASRHLIHANATAKLIAPCTCVNSITTNSFLLPPNQVHIISRNYAKGKDKKKDKGKVKVQINESQLTEVINVESYKTSLQKSLDTLKADFTKHLSLRSTTGSIESVIVNIDGKDHTLQEVAQIVRKNPKTIVLNMAVFPQAIPVAIKAIQKSGMNLNPQQEGTTIYIPVPNVTKEHRENLAKNAKALFVKCRDALKTTQTKYVKDMKRKDSISQDLQRSVEQQIIQIADDFVKQAEKILETKQTELVGKD